MTSGTGNNRGRRAPGKKPWLSPQTRMVIMIVLAVIMVIIAALCVLYTRWVKKPTLPSVDDPSGSQAVESGDVGEEDPNIDAVQPKVGGERKSQDFYTILVFGADVTSGLTDTIMVVSYDVTNQQATVMSIPRDTLVNVRASYKSINGVYNNNGRGEKGIAALKNEVSELVGFVPDFYVMVNWELVGQMVDAIGGVEYDVPYHMEYFDPFQDLNIYIEKGLQVLDGKHAMDLVRWRHNNPGVSGGGDGSDLTRLKVQQGFLKAVLKQTLQIQNVTKIGKLAELFGENVVSDLSVENLFWFGSQAIFHGLSVDNVNFITMPNIGVGDTGVYKWKVYPNQRQLLTLINESLNPFVTDVTMRELDLIAVSADGNTLSSSTGVLADPSAAIPPASDPPQVSDDPEPTDSEPVNTDPVTTDPVITDPVTTDPPVESPPITEPAPPPAESGEAPIDETGAGE